jgi:hypothetical protein
MSTISSFLIIFWPPESGYLVPRIHHPSRYYDIRKHRVDKVAWPSHFFLGGGGQWPLVPLLLLSPPFFPIILFWVHHLVHQDDRQLLAYAMASDFSVAWQCLSKRTIGFLLWIKLHALIRQGVSPPSFDTGAWNGVLWKLAWPRFEPWSPKWHTGALSTTPQAHACLTITLNWRPS